jgi:Uma2 family endonuclease
MSGYPLSKKTGFTWTDYRSWSDGKRWELIGGESFAMTPAPSTRHQLILHRLDTSLGLHFRDKPCQVFPAPTDVKLSDEDVVQPDLLIVCDPKQIRRAHIEGPPSLVVEILSPSSTLHDRIRKMALYAKFGVREVWLVMPYPSLLEVFVLEGSAFSLRHAFSKEDILRSPSFPELEITLADVFDFPIDPDEQIELIKEGHPPYAVAH